MLGRPLRVSVVASLALTLAACGEDAARTTPGGDPPDTDDPEFVPAPESCAAPDLDAPETFVPCTLGSGIFGAWTIDAAGLPAYDYRLDHLADSRGDWTLTDSDAEGEPLVRRDHWAAFGNRRVNALASNDGTVEVVTQDRGVEHLNVRDDPQGNFAGGYSFLDDGEATWSTAYAHRPRPSTTTRRFGMGYAEASLRHRGVLFTRRTSAPVGDAPVVVSEVTLENLGGRSKRLVHYEYWDVARRPIEINWAVSGDVLSLAPANARAARDARNGLFSERVSFDPAARSLQVERRYVGATPRPAREEPSAVDYWPNQPFLVQALGEVHDVYVDQAAFFGGGGPGAPRAVAERAPGAGTAGGELSALTSGAGQPHALVLASAVELAPGEQKTLRYVYGYTRAEEALAPDARWSDASWDPIAEQAEHLRERMLYFATERDPVLHRELAWHASQLEASIGYRDYWQQPVVPQGSAYLYLHGADGAARDLGLFAVPLVYTDPELARLELLFYMGIQFADGRFSYAFQGHGMLDDASLHSAPSDLCLFFLWALGEYLGATGDVAFLDAPAPFHPRGARPGATVWDHVVAAVRHHLDVVGTGQHGLVRLGTGDWSDGIVADAARDRDVAVALGESIPNTQMGVYVLDRVASLIEARDTALAGELRAATAGYRTALAGEWTGTWFRRAWYNDGGPAIGESSIDLEGQIWALISGTFADEAQRATLVSEIATRLDDPSPIGAPLWGGGQVWPAIGGLLTWGYARTDPERAFAHLARATLAARAVAFPEVWSNVWSSSDGVSSKSGQSWKSLVTPMTDWPVQNNNVTALGMLAALRVAGIEATPEGLLVAPAVPPVAGPGGTPERRLTLRARLVELELRGAVLRLRYRPTGDAPRRVEIVAPSGERVTAASIDGTPVSVTGGDERVTLDIAAGAGRDVRVEVTTAP
ncbi:MAG: hypothetical protein IT376_07280 [Polyangiaceae bacterium]|nr:hypothetical protein [Polyangiaceae bacterium]